ncbi:MAG: hypothetical protein ACM3MJ_09705 [Deltaproteobacteria bacterium]
MRRRRDSGGYVMLAALLVMVLAATFALVVVAATSGIQAVEGSDASAWRAQSLERSALARTSGLLRWRPLLSGSAAGGDVSAGQSWETAWTAAPPLAGDRWPRLRVQVSTAAGKARRRDLLSVLLRAEPWASGVTCPADVEVAAPLVVGGSGVYVGGCLRGRENVSFEEAAGAVPGTLAGGPADVVHGETFPTAAVHGGAGIFELGAEIHEVPDAASYAEDTDRHTGLPVPEDWVVGPSAEFLLAASAAAVSAGPAWTDATLHLDQIGAATGPEAITGRCILLPPVDEITLLGALEPAAGRLLIIVPGDATVGSPGETTLLSGGLVVRGHLRVRGELLLEGSLHAGSIAIDAPTRVVVHADWRNRPLAGAAMMTIVEHGQ